MKMKMIIIIVITIIFFYSLYIFCQRPVEIIWKFNAEYPFRSVTIEDNIIYVGDTRGNCYGLDKTGIKKWSFKMEKEEEILSILPKNGILYLASTFLISKNSLLSSIDYLYAIDIETKKVKWKIPSYIKYTVTDKVLYCCESRIFTAIDIETGEKIWTYNTGIVGHIPIIHNEVAYIGSMDGLSFYALDTKNRCLKWKAEIWLGILSSPVISENIIYVACKSGILYALDIETGKIIWNFCIDEKSRLKRRASLMVSFIRASPCIVGNVICFGSSGEKAGFYALNKKNGNLIWKFQHEKGRKFDFTSSFALKNQEIVCVISEMEETKYSFFEFNVLSDKWEWKFREMTEHNSYLYAFNIKTNKMEWKTKWEFNFPLTTSMPFNNILYATYQNSLFAIKIK